MDYRTPEGNIITAKRTIIITVTNQQGVPTQVPSTILNKQDLATLHSHGYRRIIYGPKQPPKFYDNAPSSDLTVDGQETITYTSTPKMTAAELRPQVVDYYFEEIRPVVAQITANTDLYNATGQAAKETEWQGYYTDVGTKFSEGQAELQRVMGLPTEQEKYEGLIDMATNIQLYIPEIPNL